MRKTLLLFSLGFAVLATLFGQKVLAQDTNYKVKVIYFYPADYTPDQRYIDAVDPFVADVQKWYGEKLGAGKTFSADPTQVVKGSKNASGYGSGVDIWYNVIGELGASCEQNTTWLIYVAKPISFNGGGNCAPHYGGTTYNGFAMNPEDLFDPQIVATNTGFCSNGYPLGDYRCLPDTSRGLTSHELGHAFTLPHPKDCGSETHPAYCEQTAMWAWWKWPNVAPLDLTVAPEKPTLLGSAWFWNSIATSTPTPVLSPTPTVNPTSTPTPTPSPTPTPTPTLKPTPSPSPVSSPPPGDSISPTVSITNPTNGSYLKRGSKVTIGVSASDNVGVTKVLFYVNGSLKCTDTVAPFECVWSVPLFSLGRTFSINAKAYDAANNSATSETVKVSATYF